MCVLASERRANAGVCECIRCGAVDVAIEVRCWETSGAPVEWGIRARGILGKNTNKHCYSLNRAIRLHYFILPYFSIDNARVIYTKKV